MPYKRTSHYPVAEEIGARGIEEEHRGCHKRPNWYVAFQLMPACIFVILLNFLLGPPAHAEKPEQLKPQGYINDFAGVLNPQTEKQLRAICTELDQKARAQIALVTIRSLEGQPLEVFSVRLATRWGVGHKGDDSGVLVLLAVTDRKYRIEVGYGLEPILPDGKVGVFGREMVPLLRQGNYGGALLLMTGRIAEVIAEDRGVALDSTVAALPRPSSGRWRASPAFFLAVLFAIGLLLSTLVMVILVSWFGVGRGKWWGYSGFGGDGGSGAFGGGGFGGGGASGSW